MEKQIIINQFNIELINQIKIHNKFIGTYTINQKEQFDIYILNEDYNIHISPNFYIITNLPF